MTLNQVIEALVFASPKPITTKELVAALRGAGEGLEEGNAFEFAKAKEPEVLAALAEIQAELPATGRPYGLVEKVNGWTLASDPSFAPWVRQLYPEAKPTRLTGPQLETLAIIAYRQPVTRADCEAVRGVAVDGVMQVLLDRGLIKIAGRAEVPGRPLLYSTTEYFLQHFGLKTTDDLPNAGELKRIPLPAAPKEEAAPAPEKKKKGAEKAAEAEAAVAGAPAEATTDAAAEAASESSVEAAPEAAAEASSEAEAVESTETAEATEAPEAPDAPAEAAEAVVDEAPPVIDEPAEPAILPDSEPEPAPESNDHHEAP